MIARQYNNRFEFWQATAVENEFGGSQITDTLLFKSWGKIITNGVGYKAKDFGIDTFENPFLIELRFRKDFDYNGKNISMRYKNEIYVIKGKRNVDEQGIEIELFCVKSEM